MISAGQIDLLAVGASAPLSMALTYVGMAGSIGIVMQNASIAQQNGQSLARAATAATCARIVAAGAAAGG